MKCLPRIPRIFADQFGIHFKCLIHGHCRQTRSSPRRADREIIGTFYDVYNELGPGFLESVYKRSMAIALSEMGLMIEVEPPVPVSFRGQIVGDFRADITVEGRVLLELKALKRIDSSTEGQILHYLRATRFEIGLLLNFGPRAEFRRFILENRNKKNPRNP